MRFPRLKSENILPVDAPIGRDKARELLVDYLRQIRFTSAEYLSSAADPFDWAADEHDQKVDDAYFNATDNIELEVQLATEDVEDLKQELEECKDTPIELKRCAKDLAAAEKRLARHQAKLEKAENKRRLAKSDYRRLLIKVANQIVSEEERM
jgi:Mg2+ and Co2+ transporter CorA